MNAKDFSIRTGSTKRGSGGTEIDVTEIAQNPFFSFEIFDSDVSVLTLASDIEFGAGSQPVDLVEDEPVEGDVATVTGWGALYSNGPSPITLQKVDVDIMSRSTCKERYGDAKVNHHMICAASPDKDACQVSFISCFNLK